MALDAVEAGMGSHQRKACLRMIETAVPGVGPMARLAPQRIAGGLMIGRPGGTIVLRVAGRALGAQPPELTGRGAFVTVRALGGSMGAKERETVLMSVDSPRDLAPALDRVALFAVASHLAPVNIRVTVRAIRPGIRKNQAHMALAAVHSRMHSLERVSSSTVIEIGEWTDGRPAQGRVAVPA